MKQSAFNFPKLNPPLQRQHTSRTECSHLTAETIVGHIQSKERLQARRFRIAVLQQEPVLLRTEERHHRHVRLSRKKTATHYQTTFKSALNHMHRSIQDHLNVEGQSLPHPRSWLMRILSWLAPFRKQKDEVHSRPRSETSGSDHWALSPETAAWNTEKTCKCEITRGETFKLEEYKITHINAIMKNKTNIITL